MFFRAQNLGPLRDAEVDLSKDLIVLAGPNNSGKTYLAWSVYGLLRFRRQSQVDHEAWARQILESPDQTIDLGQLFAQVGPDYLGSVGNEYKAKLHLCFAAESAAFAHASVSLRSDHALARMVGGVRVSASRYSFSLFWEQPGSTRVRLMVANGQAAPAGEERDGLVSLVESIGVALQHMMFSPLFPPCILFPAERIAVNIFAKELALKRTELVDEMVDADIEGQPGAPLDLVRRKAGRYPWPIRDNLNIANDLANLSKRPSPFAFLADELETAVLGGEVRVSDTGEMLFSPRNAASARLEMHLTSSVVKSLSSLVFYFRHFADSGDFIIVDEPELNLHPDNQRKVTRILAKAVRLGFKVMMSTHSDYVLRELNHLIMLSKLPEEEAQALGYDPKSALPPEKVGVYLFDEQRAEPVEVGETGFSIKTIDAVVNQLNADEQRLYARLSRE